METTVSNKNQLYPVFLKLEQLRILLVGAGNVGLEKLHSLLANSPYANITIVAPAVKQEIKELVKAHSGCVIIEKKFEEQDLDGKNLVICATDDKALHIQIKKAAETRNSIVNVADTPDLCDFYLGSIVQKGSLKIAISTNGKSPTIAKRLKEVIADMLPEEMEELLENMQRIRNDIKEGFKEKVRRLNELTKDLSPNTSNKR